ncbi:branched-chain amino acid ABC transporter permease [Natrinema sp. 1APR25-10V2]|uniref:branched-chain amino acid ABC transporter permease n=1 Tax=Natrinema sp. 1APR25-10V2 TaxID=2951081 RepID=UPI0028742407|nr:branched-chain amino acid ABC transporter permease [Natrinema sp. 1APR25-10V2]MDS0476955.1 branched-chain amino acid ABC transporter permease [Natrinema sp. 1APR25-10V2]
MNILSSLRPHRWDRYGFVIGAVLVIALAAMPFLTDNSYLIGIAFTTLMFVTLASSWNLLSGYTGYISFGHVAFFGIGGYTCAILFTDFGISIYLAILAGGVFTMLISLPVAVATIRLSDVYFSIVMLAFAELMLEIAVNLGITGGTKGKVLPVGDYTLVTYELMLAVTVVTILTSYLVVRSYFGLTLTAIHDDEGAASSLGLDTTRYKVGAFALSAFFPAIAGGIAALYWLYINPSTMFAVTTSGDMMIMSVIGGMGTVIGPILGALLLTPIRAETQAAYPFFHGIVFGLFFMVLVLTFPNGLVSLVQRSKRLKRITRRFNQTELANMEETDD